MISLWRGKPIRALTVSLKKSGGRNNLGHITIRHSGGGHKRFYRMVSLDRSSFRGQIGSVIRFEYDPSRSAPLSLIVYDSGTAAYNLAVQGMSLNSVIVNDSVAEFLPGNSMPIKSVPPGSLICSFPFFLGSGSFVACAAGAIAQVLRTIKDSTLIKLPSGERRFFSSSIWAVLGTPLISEELKGVISSKAGRTRWLGRRPSVRGVAMNPVDHPHGGGQGKTSGGRPSVSPWGMLTKGYVTSPLRFASRNIYKHRRLIAS